MLAQRLLFSRPRDRGKVRPSNMPYPTSIAIETSNGIRTIDSLCILSKSEIGNVVRLTLAGKMSANGIGELRREIEGARKRRKPILVDLGEITLVDRVSADYLNSVAGGAVRFENCPSYLRRWIANGATR